MDLLIWDDLPESFHREIDRNYVVVQRGLHEQVPIADDRFRRVSIGDLIEIKHGFAFKGSFIHDESQGDVLLTPGNFAVGGGFKGEKFKYYDGPVPDEFVLSEGDLLVTMTDLSKLSDTLGYPAFVPDDLEGRRYLHNQRLGKISLKKTEEIDVKYLYYVMCTEGYRHEVLASATGTTVKHTSPDRIKQFKFILPPLPEQRAIAHILGTLDDKIELNRRMNQTLEAMARAIFQDWFVDFGPVRAKLEGREPYLPPELWDLFPDRLVDSELGEVPEGWEVRALGDLCDKPQYGYTQSAIGEPIGPKFLRITDINKRAWIEWESVPHCEIVEEDFKKYRLREGDILIARMADPGHGCMIEEEQDAVFASYLIRFRPKKKCYARFLQYWLRSDSYWELVKGRGAGTTRVSLNAKVLSSFPVLVPDDALLDVLGELMDDLRSRVVANTYESRVLAAQRDALLPKLVSGEMGVCEAKSTLQEMH